MYDFFSGLSADEFAQVMGYDDELSLGTAISMMAGGYAPLWASEILGGGQPDGGFGVNIRWDLLPVFSPVLTQDMILDAIFRELDRRLDTEQKTTFPTTAEPTTIATTEPPTTTEPPVTTVAPTTVSPTTTVLTTTVVPTTILPTTVQPTTIAPTTVAPTTTLPITIDPITTTLDPTTTLEPTTTRPPMMTTTVAPTTTPPVATTEVPTTEPPTTIVDPGTTDPDFGGGNTVDDLTRDKLISHATSFVQDEEAMKRLLAELEKGTPLDEGMNKILQEIALAGGGIGIEIIGASPENILISIPGLPQLTEAGINKIPLKNPDGTWKTPGEITKGVGDIIGETIGKVAEIPGEIIGKVGDILESGSPEDVFVIIEDIFKEGTYIGPNGTVHQTPPWLTPDILDDLKGLIGDIFGKWENGDEEATSLFGVEFPDTTVETTVPTTQITVAPTPTPDPTSEPIVETTTTIQVTLEGTTTQATTAQATTALPPDDTTQPPEVTTITEPTTTLDVITEPTTTLQVTQETTGTPEITFETTGTPEVTIEPTPTDPGVTPDPTTPPEGGGGGGGGMFSGTGTGYMAGLPYQPPGFVPVLYQQARNPAMNALDKVIQDSLFKGMI